MSKSSKNELYPYSVQEIVTCINELSSMINELAGADHQTIDNAMTNFHDKYGSLATQVENLLLHKRKSTDPVIHEDDFFPPNKKNKSYFAGVRTLWRNNKELFVLAALNGALMAGIYYQMQYFGAKNMIDKIKADGTIIKKL